MDIIGAFLVGFLATLLGAISTGANLISIPGLIFLGASPTEAIASSRMAAAGGGAMVAWRYNKSGMVVWRYIPMLIVVTVVAALLGPKLLLYIPEKGVEIAVGALLIASLPLLFTKKHQFGEKRKTTSRMRKIIGLAVMFLVMTYSTAFVAGGGVFIMYTLTYFYGLTLSEGTATGHVLWALGGAVALVAYFAVGAVVLSLAVPMLLGSMLGGPIGVKLAVKNGVAWVKYVLAFVIVVSGVKLLFF